MVAFAAEIDIAAPPHRVWQVLNDISLESRWMKAARETRFIAGNGYARGARMQRRGGFMGYKLDWQSDIVEVVSERLIAFAHSGTVQGSSRWELTPAPGGGTHVRFTSEGPAPGPLKWLPALAATAGRAGLRGDLRRLKQLVEERAKKSG